MRTAAVICELNPLHNGHALLFSEAKRLCGADFLIAIMSGNFVQRGEPAVFDKFIRAEMALLAGADLVIELPPLFAMSSAREFARAGVTAAEKTGVTDILAFGAEGTAPDETSARSAQIQKNADFSDEIEQPSAFLAADETASEQKLLRQLQAAANMLPETESAEFQAELRRELKKGQSYPKARMAALRAQIEDEQKCGAQTEGIFERPNNLLAIEYLRVLHASGSRIAPLAVQRRGDGYHAAAACDKVYASATALRAFLFAARKENGHLTEEEKTFLAKYCPREVLPLYEKALSGPLASAELLSPLLNQRILEISSGRGRFADFTAYSDMPPALSDRLMKNAGRITGFSGRVQQLKTRQYTQTRITRALLHVALGVEVEELARQKNAGYVQYLRILGFRQSAAALLAELKKNAAVPIVTKPAAHKDLIGQDAFYDQLYYALLADGAARMRSEYEHSPIILPD